MFKENDPWIIGFQIKRAELNLQLFKNFVLKAQELSFSFPHIPKRKNKTHRQRQLGHMSCEVCRQRKRNDRAQLEFNVARDAKNNNEFWSENED